MNRFFVVALAILVSSCSNPKEDESTASEIEVEFEPKRLIVQYVPESFLVFNEEKNMEEVRQTMHGNLFGKFFCDRAEFYIIDNPSNRIFESAIQSITLCFLDGKLRQTRYSLDGNVVDDLIGKLGNFSITPRDLKNQEIVESKEVVVTGDADQSLNKNLDNYEIRWTLEDRHVIYRVNQSTDEKYFIYTERSINYEHEFWTVENNCI
jgi:hypothetical protein